MVYLQPHISLASFSCPTCGAFAHMNWSPLLKVNHQRSYYAEAECSHCSISSLWLIKKAEASSGGRIIYKEGLMLLPDTGNAPPPESDMPQDVKDDYLEAAMIAEKSPRGAAALLRLGLQKLCRHLGEPGENINTDIRALASKNVLSPIVVKVADTVRITGNNAVHPGQMSEEDFDHVSSKLFELLNFIVKKAISEPKELDKLYNLTPKKPREDAEKQDEKSRAKGQ